MCRFNEGILQEKKENINKLINNKKHMSRKSKEEILKTKTTHETYYTLTNLLRTSQKLIYTRFGDGDIEIMMGRNQRNHDFSKELQQEMIEAFLVDDASYLRALTINYRNERGMYNGFFARYNRNDEMNDFLINRFGFTKQILFENEWFPQIYTIYHPKEMNSFLDEFIRNKKKMFIGGVDKEIVEKLVGKIDCYIRVPHRNAYGTIQEWWPEVLKNLNDVEIILPAAGMSTRVINKRLWKLNRDLISIDLGSVVDAVAGLNTRRWIRLKKHVIHRVLLPPFNKKPWYYFIYQLIREIKFHLSCWHFEIKHFKTPPRYPESVIIK